MEELEALLRLAERDQVGPLLQKKIFGYRRIGRDGGKTLKGPLGVARSAKNPGLQQGDPFAGNARDIFFREQQPAYNLLCRGVITGARECHGLPVGQRRILRGIRRRGHGHGLVKASAGDQQGDQSPGQIQSARGILLLLDPGAEHRR